MCLDYSVTRPGSGRSAMATSRNRAARPGRRRSARPARPSHSGGPRRSGSAVEDAGELRGAPGRGRARPAGWSRADGDRPLGVLAQRQARHAERRGLLLDAARVGEHHARRRRAAAGSRGSRAAAMQRAARSGMRDRAARARAAVRGCTGKTSGSSRATSPSVSSKRPSVADRRRSTGRCSVSTPYRSASAAARAMRVGCRAARQVASSVSIMTLPTKWMLLGRTPSRAGCRAPSGAVVNSRSLSASVTMRLISSGIVRSKLRSPASTWATRHAQLRRDQAQASVELTSPTTTTRSGRSSTTTGSKRHHHLGGLLGVGARADAQVDVGRRQPELVEEHVGHRLVVVLAGVHQHAGECAAGARARETGATFMKFGRAPTTCSSFIREIRAPAGYTQSRSPTCICRDGGIRLRPARAIWWT